MRKLFGCLPKSRWKRYVVPTIVGGFTLLLLLVTGGYFLWRIPKVQSLLLRNTNASRAGVAGVLGLDLPRSEAGLEFANVAFTNVGVRFKGNGTFLAAQRTYKRSFKIDLKKHMKSQKLVGRATLNFGNLSADFSFLSDALANEFYRDAGVPASRTGFARLLLTIDGRFGVSAQAVFRRVRRVGQAPTEGQTCRS